MKKWISAGIVTLTLTSFSAAASLITPNINLEVNDNNGAISLFEGFGLDYFNPGARVSNYGFGTLSPDNAVSNFAAAQADGVVSGGLSVSSVVKNANSVTVNGLYDGFGSFVRTYRQVGSLDVIAIDTSFTSTLDGLFSFLFFETFDPDQGASAGLNFATFNDVVDLPGVVNANGESVKAATSLNENSVNPFLLASLTATATEAGDVFSIENQFSLADVLNSPIDGSGTFFDRGSHIVTKIDNQFNETVSFTTYLATTNGDLNSGLALLAEGINADTKEVPAPSTLAVLALGLIGIGLRRRRND